MSWFCGVHERGTFYKAYKNALSVQYEAASAKEDIVESAVLLRSDECKALRIVSAVLFGSNALLFKGDARRASLI